MTVFVREKEEKRMPRRLQQNIPITHVYSQYLKSWCNVEGSYFIICFILLLLYKGVASGFQKKCYEAHGPLQAAFGIGVFAFGA